MAHYSPHTAGVCSSSEVLACLNEVAIIGHIDHRHRGIFPVLNDAQLDAVCGAYNSTHECIERSTEDCSAAERHQLMSRDDALHFLCHDGYLEYKEIRSCLSTQAVLHDATQCNRTLSQNLEALKHTQDNFPDHHQQMCGYVEDYLNCMKNKATTNCGDTAGDWTYHIKSLLMAPTFSELDCYPAESTSYAPVITLSIAIFIGIVFLIILGALCYKFVMTHGINGDGMDSIETATNGRVSCQLKLTYMKQQIEGKMPLLNSVIVEESEGGEEEASEKHVLMETEASLDEICDYDVQRV